MLNVVVMMIPHKEEGALALYTPNRCTPNHAFIDELREVNHMFSVFFKGLVNQMPGCWNSTMEFNASQRQACPEHWDKFIEFCENDGRIAVYRKDDEVMFGIPVHFEE